MRLRFRIVVAVLTLIPILSNSVRGEEKLSPDQAALRFVSKWYMLGIRGLPSQDQVDKISSCMAEDLKIAFVKAADAKFRAAKMTAEGPAPWHEGDFLGGAWENPNGFWISGTEIGEDKAKISFKFLYEEGNFKEEAGILIKLSKIDGEWRVVDVVTPHQELLKSLNNIIIEGRAYNPPPEDKNLIEK